MNESSLTKIGKVIKTITGIRDISLFRKKWRKRIGKIIYHKKYDVQDLIVVMRNMGMQRGSVVCIHSSMREFYNYRGTVNEIIDGIMEVITEEGTLIMPCFPKKDMIRKSDYIFTLDDPTGAGYMSEIFRKYPEVKRSINVQHSVAVWGKYAEWLTKDHHKCKDCWDTDSPWRRMLSLDVLVFNFGLPRSFMGTFRHCLESSLKDEHPYWAQFFTKEVEYRYLDNDGIVRTYKSKTKEIERRNATRYPSKYFDTNDWKICKISNLEIKVFYTNRCFPKMLQLGRKGISPYSVPSTDSFVF